METEENFKLTFKIGPEDGKQYVLKKCQRFLGHIYREEMHSYGKQLAFVHSKKRIYRDSLEVHRADGAGETGE